MTERRSKGRDESTDEEDVPTTTSAAETQVAVPSDVEPSDLPYTLGEWGGKPLWKCRYCLHATPDGEYAFYKHLERHLDSLGEMADQPSSGLVDTSGKPL